MRKNKTAIKRAKQALARRLRNSHTRSTMKTCIKKAMNAIETNDSENLNALFTNAVSCIDKAASKGVIHKNTASRKISKLSKRVHAMAGNG